MHDADLGTSARGYVRWVPSREKPRRIHVGEMGTAADLITGDIAVDASGRTIWVSFRTNIGTVVAHVNSGFFTLDTSPASLVEVKNPNEPVRILGLRPWAPAHAVKLKQGR